MSKIIFSERHFLTSKKSHETCEKKVQIVSFITRIELSIHVLLHERSLLYNNYVANQNLKFFVVNITQNIQRTPSVCKVLRKRSLRKSHPHSSTNLGAPHELFLREQAQLQVAPEAEFLQLQAVLRLLVHLDDFFRPLSAPK